MIKTDFSTNLGRFSTRIIWPMVTMGRSV